MRAAMLVAVLVLPRGSAQAQPRSDPLTVLLPGESGGFWSWALRPEALPDGMNLHLEFAGHPPTAVTESLLVKAVRDELPAMALVRAHDAPRLAALGLMTDLSAEPVVVDWRQHQYPIRSPLSGQGEGDGPQLVLSAGVLVPLVLLRPDVAAYENPPATWPELLQAAQASTDGDMRSLDPGDFATTFTWLRMRAGIGASGMPGDITPGWPQVLDTLRQLHDAPAATRFWEKRWAPVTATFRRGGAHMAVADTTALQFGSDFLAGVRAVPFPALGFDPENFPVAIPAVWLVPRGTDMARVQPLLAYLLSPEFAGILAEHRGWAPTRRDAWDGMAALRTRTPAWETVRLIMEDRELTGELVGEIPEVHNAALARSAGLWLAGVHADAGEAWQRADESLDTAWRKPEVGRRRFRMPHFPTSAVGMRSEHTELQTFAQGEHTVLPYVLHVNVDPGLTTTSRLRARHADETWLIDHTVYEAVRNRDELRPVDTGEGRVDDGMALRVEVAVPSGMPTGEFDFVLDFEDGEGEMVTRVSLGRARVTATPTLPLLTALCGLGLPGDSPYVNQVGRLLLEHGFTPFPLGTDSPLLSDPRRGPVVLRQWHDPTTAVADAKAADAAGVRDALLVYSYDEPTLLHFPHLRKEAVTYADLRVPVLVTHPPDALLVGAANTWGVHTFLLPTDTPAALHAWPSTLDGIGEARARGEDVWWYTAGDVAPLPNLQLDADMVRLQAAFYRLPALGFNGVLQAAAAAWGENPFDLDAGALGIGEGVLCFPAPGEEPAVNPTVRLKALRDGVFTMRLLAALHVQLADVVRTLPNADGWRLYADERLAAYGRSVVDPAALALGDAVHPFMHLAGDAQHLQYVATRLRLELEAVLAGPLLLLHGDAGDWTVTTTDTLRLNGRVLPTARVHIDGLPASVGPDGIFAADVALQPGWNAPEVVATRQGKTRRMRWHVWRGEAALSGP